MPPVERSFRTPIRSLASISLLLVLLTSGCATKAPPPPPPKKEVEKAIRPPKPLKASTPLAERIDVEALRMLVERAELSQTSELVVLRNGRLAGSWSFDNTDVKIPLETANMTSSIVGLGIAALIDDGKLSFDDELQKFFPELKGKPAGAVRIRHIMTHTSGLPDPSLGEIYRAEDAVQFAVSGPLTSRPGRRFRYNNSALNLLPKIASQVWGKSFEHLMDRRIFLPMGIERRAWRTDPNGNVYAMANLELSAVDLAKIGWMMAQAGAYQNRRILSAGVVKRLLQPTRGVPHFGRTWWMAYPNARKEITPEGVTALERKDFDPDIIESLRDIQGERIPVPEFDRFLETNLGNDVHAYRDFKRQRRVKVERVLLGAPEGFVAKGALGQTMVVLPKRRLVVVRLRKPRPGLKKRADALEDIVSMSNRLAAD